MQQGACFSKCQFAWKLPGSNSSFIHRDAQDKRFIEKLFFMGDGSGLDVPSAVTSNGMFHCRGQFTILGNRGPAARSRRVSCRPGDHFRRQWCEGHACLSFHAGARAAECRIFAALRENTCRCRAPQYFAYTAVNDSRARCPESPWPISPGGQPGRTPRYLLLHCFLGYRADAEPHSGTSPDP